MLYRVFPYVEGAAPRGPGGALYVPRERQGSGRHDMPDLYGALYVSRTVSSAVAERIQRFRGQVLDQSDFLRRDGTANALVALDDSDVFDVIDLDDPQELAHRDIRPSRVATRDRRITQPIAAALFNEGHCGFAWWSVLESAWTNVTLFAERAVMRLRILGEPEPLRLDHPAVRAAAEILGVGLR